MQRIARLWYSTVSQRSVLTKTKVKFIFVLPVVNVQKGSREKCHSWTHFRRSIKLKCVLEPCCEKSAPQKTNIQG
jgi:hypothetical protein